ncbi:RNB domain-containing ribonuclease [Actinomyces naeslundii]|uniref:RNB-like protein n=2 Tax=Actinomyces naeslundii TaxID=1655 RepID=J3ABW7_ACTNH|nr:RNB domain-containing ribonuclease [Actinomyces naeslundii]EJN85313.1 RNB-like protein [Actinomyces naeslundii str. Howell 279]OMG32969.1 DNA-binding protein [Actinomyces naeslundii]OMG35771.1 DNA-binding protein [Actinomyces naeslundii]QQC21636.1 RNB domain-containing ribonuclease [Actinomyces naeslundii]
MSRKRLSTYTAPPAEVVRALDELRARYEVPTAFPPEALAEAEAAATSWAQDGPARLLADGARDARDLELVTIDPPGSMDLDQAVLLERLPAWSEAAGTSVGDAPGSAATYRIHYAIASLATFVPPGGALDAELSRRGETIYAPDAATPLHPEVLSHGAASLLEDVDRPACLWTIDLDARGEVVSARVERALVRSRARLTYGQVQAAIDGEGTLPSSAPTDLPGLLAEIGRLRLEREVARGGISMTTPEQVVEVTEAAGSAEDSESAEAPGPSGYRLAYRVPVPAEQYNAQISLLTGMCAARIMVECGVGILRTLPPARPEDYARLRRVAAALGIDWPAAQPYSELVRGLDHAVPAHAAFMDQAMSLFRGSGYLAFGAGGVGVPADDEAADAEEAVHSAIAARYAHVTAPLRRLVDRYGEEVCIAACAQAPVPEWVLQALPDLPDVMEQTGKRARAIGRGALTALEALVLRGHEGEVFDGVITSEREGRGELVLTEPAVVTEVRRGSGQSGDRLPVGERVRVRLLSADPAAGIRFQLLAAS